MYGLTYNMKFANMNLIFLIGLFGILLCIVMNCRSNSGGVLKMDKKVKIKTDLNKEVEYEIKNEKLQSPINTLNENTPNENTQNENTPNENTPNENTLNENTLNENTQNKLGYMTEKELEDYAPDGLKYCSDVHSYEKFDAPLFYNVPPASSELNGEICRNCKVGYCMGDVCGSEIYKKGFEMENYFL
uniref:Uncharacterized protein n=1 Tax=viral metagenome TaxID=1070528 RepID=A0A6C0ECV0_9ZZZZ